MPLSLLLIKYASEPLLWLQVCSSLQSNAPAPGLTLAPTQRPPLDDRIVPSPLHPANQIEINPGRLSSEVAGHYFCARPGGPQQVDL